MVGARNVLLSASVHTSTGAHPTPSRGIKQPGCGVDHPSRVMPRLFIPPIHLRAEVFRYRETFVLDVFRSRPFTQWAITL